MASQGLSGFEVGSWFGVLAPDETPEPILTMLDQEIVKALNAPKVIEAMRIQGVTTKPGTPEAASWLVDSEMQKWSELIETTGVTAAE